MIVEDLIKRIEDVEYASQNKLLITLYPYYVADSYGEIWVHFSEKEEAEKYIKEYPFMSDLEIITRKQVAESCIKQGNLDSLIYYQK